MVSSGLSAARKPGIASILSRVPPVCPRPRPDSCGTAAPHAATRGTRTSDTLSPTPPVECLSTVGRPIPDRSSRRPLATIAAPHRLSSSGLIPAPTRGGPARLHPPPPDRHQVGGHLPVGDLGTGVGVDEPVDRVAGQSGAVPLGPDQFNDVEVGTVEPGRG